MNGSGLLFSCTTEKPTNNQHRANGEANRYYAVLRPSGLPKALDPSQRGINVRRVFIG